MVSAIDFSYWKRRRKLGKKEWALLGVSFIWGTTFGLGKYVLDYLPTAAYLALRFLLASMFLLLFYYKVIRQTSRKEAILSCLLGISICLSYFTQTWGLNYTTASKNAFICGLYVVLVPYFAWIFFRQRLTVYALGSAFLAVIGLGCLSFTEDNALSFGLGDCLALISAVFAALQIICIGRFAKEINYIRMAFFQMLTVSLLCSTAAFWGSGMKLDLPWQVWAMLLFLAVFATTGAFIVQAWAQRDVSNSVTAIIFSLESVFGAAFACAFLREPFSLQMLLGSALLFAAMILSQREEKGRTNIAVSE